MIDLTPLEVRKKKGDFRKSMRGYDPQSVDDFLDLVADRLEQLVRENVALHERTASTDVQIAEYRDRERALTEALVTAQEMREEMRRQMEREVELKRREAEADADEIRAGASQIREREEENVRRLRARQNQFVQSYRSFLERELAELAVIVETLDATSMGDPDRPATPAPRKRAKRVEPEATEQPSNRITEQPSNRTTEQPSNREKPKRPREVAPEPTPAPPPAAAREAEHDFETESYEPPPPFEREPPDPDVLEPDQELIDMTMHFPSVTPVQGAQLDFSAVVNEEIEDVVDTDDDIPELELMDEVTDEEDDDGEDPDGWVSTLLEGKGD